MIATTLPLSLCSAYGFQGLLSIESIQYKKQGFALYRDDDAQILIKILTFATPRNSATIPGESV